MSSAAKLRKAGRGTAVLASAALIMTSFGPAAFAWVAPPIVPDFSADDAGAASIGLVDTDLGAAGTQGATAVALGADSQAIGDVRFVLPSTWRVGDYVEFVLGGKTGTTGTGPVNDATAANQLSFASNPAVTIDPKPYAATTHVAANSPTTAGSDVPGATEAGNEQPYTGTGAAAIAPLSADAYTITYPANTTTGRNDRVRITFNGTQNLDTAGAKFIGKISGAKVNVGTGLSPNTNVTLAGVGYQASPPNTPAGTALPFFGDAETGRNATVVARTSVYSLDITNGGVVADGTNQTVGPMTIRAATGSLLAGANTVTLTGGEFVTQDAKVYFYNAAGTLLNASGTVFQPSGATATVTAPATATRAVIEGAMVTGTTTPGSVTYSLTTAAGAATATGTVSDEAPFNQIDIQAPGVTFKAAARRTAVPDRLGGSSRYQTAVKIAEALVGTTPNSIMGEADNVVLATGQQAADALSAGYLAATKNAPILLTRTNVLEPEVKEFLRNYGAKNIYIVGGNNAVSQAVERELRDTQATDIQGVSTTETQTQYTSVLTLNAGGSTDGSATLSPTSSPASPRLTNLAVQPGSAVAVTIPRDGDGRVSANSASVTGLPGATVTNVAVTIAGAAASAIVSVDGNTFTVSVPAQDAAGGTDDVVAFATTTSSGTTSREVLSEGATATGANRRVVPLTTDLSVMRLAGNSRWETNRRVNEYAAQSSSAPMGTTVAAYGEARKNTAILANGYMGIIDALTAGPLVGNSAGQNPMPVILTMGDQLHHEARGQLNTLTVKHLLAVGGTAVIPDSVVGEANKLGATVDRLEGANRWETAAAVIDFAVRENAASTTNPGPGLGLRGLMPLLANGAHPRADGWADALTSGPLAVQRGTFIAITSQSYLPSEIKEALSETRAFVSEVTAIGLANAVGNNVVDDANAAVN